MKNGGQQGLSVDAWLNAMQSSMYMGYLIAIAKQLEDSAVAGSPVHTSMAGIRKKSSLHVGGLLVDHFGMVSTDAMYRNIPTCVGVCPISGAINKQPPLLVVVLRFLVFLIQDHRASCTQTSRGL